MLEVPGHQVQHTRICLTLAYVCVMYVCMYVYMYICICFFSQCADAEEHLADDSLGEFVHH